MKVMQIMGGSGEGGLEKHVVELSNAMSAKCSVVVVAHPKYEGRFSDRVIFVPLDLSKSRRNPLLLFKLLRIIKAHQPDIVHAQANKAGLIIASLKGLLSCKTVVTIHNLKKNLGFLSKFDLSIGVSEGVVGQFSDAVSKKTVYNGIPKPHVSHTPILPAFSDEQLPTVLSVGRLVPAKGFDVLLAAWEGINANLVIAGDGPDRQLLEEMIQTSLHLQRHVHLLGHRDDVPNLIATADMLVISSRREGFSYVFSESLLLETPVISTDVPIPNEILPREYICAVEDVEALRRLIEVSIEQSAIIEEHFTPIYKYAAENLTIETMVEQTWSAYQAL